MRIGYLQILRFTNRTPDELQTAIAMLRDESVQALVVDLRNNSGGLLQESVDVADLFLDGGVIVL
jgi:carboxyl-terminal processing protease